MRQDRGDLVVLAGGLWDERWTTYQRITLELARHFRRTLYVEANHSWGKVVSAARPGSSLRLEPLGGIRQVDEGVHVLRPRPRLPGRHWWRPLGVWHQARLRAQVRAAMERLEIRRPVLWSCLPLSDQLLGRLDERLSVYHCVDYWPWLKSQVPLLARAAQVEEDERRTARRADLAFATSRFLVERIRGWCPDVHWLPNAADELFFSDAGERPERPPELAHLTGPILGFSGSLEVKSDLDLLCRLANHRADWSLVLVGQTDNVPDLARLTGLPNVHRIGLQPRERVPAFLAAFDVCLVPFRRSPELESISPLKVFEYLASGRPVVATRYGEIEFLQGVVELVDDSDEFVAAVERCLVTDDEEARERRLAVAREHSWAARGRRILDVIDAREERCATTEIGSVRTSAGTD